MVPWVITALTQYHVVFMQCGMYAGYDHTHKSATEVIDLPCDCVLILCEVLLWYVFIT